MPDETSPNLAYADFLNADPRRCGDALEIGHDFTDPAGDRHRVCWYAETGELTIERLVHPDALDLEDFHEGIATAQVLTRIDRPTLERLLGVWPQVERLRPHTIQRLHELLEHG